MSIHITISRGMCDALDGLERTITSKGNKDSWDQIKGHVPFYKTRQNLRERLDTKPGVRFLQNNAMGAIPFAIIGMPAAELSHSLVEKYIGDSPEALKYGINSLATVTTQLATWYTSFMINEVRTHREKYSDENGKLSTGKIAQGTKRALRAFLPFDLVYSGIKTLGQSGLLALGKNPWIASIAIDAIASPAWYFYGVPSALREGIIETKHTKRLKRWRWKRK